MKLGPILAVLALLFVAWFIGWRMGYTNGS